jgi:hypothetical protein
MKTPRWEAMPSSVCSSISHAQLGSFDMQASASSSTTSWLQADDELAVRGTDYALCDCQDVSRCGHLLVVGLDLFPDRLEDREGELVGRTRLFHGGSARHEQERAHAELSDRIQQAQWHHEQGQRDGFVQFVGPAHPLVISRYSDVNQDGKADYYDGFLDFQLKSIQTDLQASATPRDPGVSATQIGGEAATGLNWAAGSLNRVTQYSDLWRGLPGDSELFYIFLVGWFLLSP